MALMALARSIGGSSRERFSTASFSTPASPSNFRSARSRGWPHSRRRICQAQGPRPCGLRYPLRPRPARRLRGLGIQSLCWPEIVAAVTGAIKGLPGSASRARSRLPTDA
jgi:hypothetical protein